MNDAYRRHIPALGFDFLTPFYDPPVTATTRERVPGSRLGGGEARMRFFLRVLMLACTVSAASFAARADEGEIRRVIGAKLSGVAIESVRPGPAGLFEVVCGVTAARGFSTPTPRPPC